MAAEPLAPHRLLETDDIDAVCEITSRLLGITYKLEPLRPDATPASKLNAVAIGDVQLGYLEIGTPVRFQVEEFSMAYMISIQLGGSLEATHRNETVVSGKQRAVVFNAGQGPASGSWTGTPLLVVNIPRPVLDAELRAHLGRDVLRPVTFDLGMDLWAPATQSWLAALRLVRWECEGPGRVIRHRPVAEQIERLLVTELLFAHSNNYSQELLNPQPPARPRAVKRAMEMIEGDPQRSLSVTDLASAVGVSVRGLQEGFVRHVGMSPMSYLREVRLARAHFDLLAADPELVTVACVAKTWGFAHLGRFAATYQKKYGVLPSETLKR